MDLEELKTGQIILLSVLASFVTSIMTGIITVSLLSEAPPAVTQTVNHVIERTIETVVPKNTTQTQTTKETTVVVKEDDLITASIAQSLSKTGRVFGGTSSTTDVVGLAEQVSAGTIVTDLSIVEKDHLVMFGNSSAIFTVSQRFPDIGIAILTLKNASTTPAVSFKVADVSALKLGTTAIALVSVTNERVAIGAVSSRSNLGEVTQKGQIPITVRSVDTTVSAQLVPGTPLVNIFGDLIGISTGVSQESGRGSFVAASDITALIAGSRATSTPSH